MQFVPAISVLLFMGMVPLHACADSAKSAEHASSTATKRMPILLESFPSQTLFETSDQPMELAALTTSEMKETEGAWGPWGAAAGGIGAGIGYTYNTHITHTRWSTTNFGTQVAVGAAAGGFAGPAGAIWAFNSAVATGIATGVITSKGW